MKKIEQKELESLRYLNKKFNDLRSKLADLEISKRNIENQKSSVFNQMDGLSSEFRSLEAELLEKYGNVKVNLETGEYDEN